MTQVTTNNEQGAHKGSSALPLAGVMFLQGTASYDYTDAASIPVTSVSCDATNVTIGAQLLPGYTGDPVNVRWCALFKNPDY